MAGLNIVIDQMQLAGHIDSWCKEHCDPHKLKELDDVSKQLLILH